MLSISGWRKQRAVKTLFHFTLENCKWKKNITGKNPIPQSTTAPRFRTQPRVNSVPFPEKSKKYQKKKLPAYLMKLEESCYDYRARVGIKNRVVVSHDTSHYVQSVYDFPPADIDNVGTSTFSDMVLTSQDKQFHNAEVEVEKTTISPTLQNFTESKPKTNQYAFNPRKKENDHEQTNNNHFSEKVKKEQKKKLEYQKLLESSLFSVDVSSIDKPRTHIEFLLSIKPKKKN